MKSNFQSKVLLSIFAVVSGASAFGLAFHSNPNPTTTEDTAFWPEKRPLSDDLLNQLKLQPGFEISVFAREVGNARMLAVADNGTVYVTCPAQSHVLLLRDTNDDGKADEIRSAAEDLEKVHGISLHGGKVYLANINHVFVADIKTDGSFTTPKPIISDLPEGGQHWKRTLAVGPDNMLYISIGSDCNACAETNPEHASILQAALDGSSRKVFAKGLRNTLGFDWHPETGEMWGMDHGSDDRGDDLPPEELNRILADKNYGWPYAYGGRQGDPKMHPSHSPKMTNDEYAKTTEPAAISYQAHSAPIGFAFYKSSQFPEHYREGAFVAFRGSWNRFPAIGYKIAFVPFEKGRPREFEDFVTGFLIEDGKAQFARVAGVAVAKDGSLLFTDDEGGVIYRVSYKENIADH